MNSYSTNDSESSKSEEVPEVDWYNLSISIAGHDLIRGYAARNTQLEDNMILNEFISICWTTK